MDDPIIETVGQFLRRIREEKRLSLEDVTMRTRIQAVLLKAIEEGQFDKLSSLVSLRGFVRSYARFLELDDVEILKRLSESLSEKRIKPTATVPSQQGAPQAEGHALAENGPAQASLFPMGNSSQNTETGTNNISLDMGTVGERTQKASAYMQWVGVSAVCLLVALLLKFYIPFGNTPNKIVLSYETPIATPTARNIPLPLVIIPAESVVSDLPNQKESDVDRPLILSLEAREPTWVKVLIDGKGAKDIILQTGQKAVWQADKTFLLTMGNGGGAEVSLDGKGLGFLGKRGEVVKDRLLTRVASEQTIPDNE
jgi:transcriptional regulator with XRE-family HTH domain